MSLFGKYELILAPMAGITDLSFRLICEECGTDLAFCEMVSAMGLEHASMKTHKLIDIDDREREVGVQLFGHDASVLANQAKEIEQELGERLAYLDINMGCPAKKIVKKGDGAALMKTPELAASIVSGVKEAVSCRVTAKFRRGFNLNDETCVAFAKQMENAGADAITVHGRFAEQYYRGESSFDAIKRVVDAVSIPVVGNGDVKDVGSYKKMLSTGCSAVMIARAASHNPLIFTELKGNSIPEEPVSCFETFLNSVPEEAEGRLEGRIQKLLSNRDDIARLNLAIKHARLCEENMRSGRKNLVHFRVQAMNYVEGIPGAREARKRFCTCTTANDFITVFEDLRSSLS